MWQKIWAENFLEKILNILRVPHIPKKEERKEREIIIMLLMLCTAIPIKRF